jgi:hypothetical protein
MLLFDLRAHGGDLALIAQAVDHDVAARASESFGRGQAETLCGTGDECALALKHGGCLPL